MTATPLNFALLDADRPEVARLIAAMVQARDAVKHRSWSHRQEPSGEEWWADVLADPRARKRRRRTDRGKQSPQRSQGQQQRDQTTGQTPQRQQGQQGQTGQAPQQGQTGQQGQAPQQGQAQPSQAPGQAQQGQAQQGQARGSVNLTTQQRTEIRQTVLAGGNVPRVNNVDFALRAGTTVPSSVRVVEVPAALIQIHPQWRGHMYFVVGEQIIIVDRNHRIVAVIEV